MGGWAFLRVSWYSLLKYYQNIDQNNNKVGDINYVYEIYEVKRSIKITREEPPF